MKGGKKEETLTLSKLQQPSFWRLFLNPAARRHEPHRAVPDALDLSVVALVVDDGLKCLNRVNELPPDLGSKAIQNHHETV